MRCAYNFLKLQQIRPQTVQHDNTTPSPTPVMHWTDVTELLNFICIVGSGSRSGAASKHQSQNRTKMVWIRNTTPGQHSSFPIRRKSFVVTEIKHIFIFLTQFLYSKSTELQYGPLPSITVYGNTVVLLLSSFSLAEKSPSGRIYTNVL
jgi:hypothetical protein